MADYDRSFKILLVGDAGVGKSAMLQRFVERHHAKHHVPTLGVDFRLRTIGLNGERIKLHVFDTSGQDRSQNIARAYYRSAEGVLLCYDLSSDESLQNVARWEEAIRQYAPPGVPVVLVGLKADARRTRSRRTRSRRRPSPAKASTPPSSASRRRSACGRRRASRRRAPRRRQRWTAAASAGVAAG